MQGVQITPQIRLAVVNTKTFFDGLKNDHSLLDLASVTLTADHMPTFAIDQLAATQGHTIVRTPPYHPELQPIETAWAVYKTSIARQNDCR